MTISFRAELNHQVNQSTETKKCQKGNVSNTVIDDNPEDCVDISTDNDKPEKTEKTSGWQKVKNGYTGFRKGLITAGEYAVGTVKGLIYGSAAGLAIIGADAVRGIIKKSPNYISTKGKVLAGIAGAAVLVCNLFNANLNANEKKSALDHRWQTGHNH